MSREIHKKEAYLETRSVWERRQAFVDLKRKFPTLGGREEEDLLFDKERIPKKPKPVVEPAPYVLCLLDSRSHRLTSHSVPPVRLPKRPNDASASPAPVEPQMRPKDRFSNIQQNLEALLKKMKEQDHGWEDQVDVGPSFIHNIHSI